MHFFLAFHFAREWKVANLAYIFRTRSRPILSETRCSALTYFIFKPLVSGRTRSRRWRLHCSAGGQSHSAASVGPSPASCSAHPHPLPAERPPWPAKVCVCVCVCVCGWVSGWARGSELLACGPRHTHAHAHTRALTQMHTQTQRAIFEYHFIVGLDNDQGGGG